MMGGWFAGDGFVGVLGFIGLYRVQGLKFWVRV